MGYLSCQMKFLSEKQISWVTGNLKNPDTKGVVSLEKDI